MPVRRQVCCHVNTAPEEIMHLCRGGSPEDGRHRRLAGALWVKLIGLHACYRCFVANQATAGALRRRSTDLATRSFFHLIIKIASPR